MKKTMVLLALTGLLAAGAAYAETTQWLHVRVEQKAGKEEVVRVNVPVTLARVVAPIVEKEVQAKFQKADKPLAVEDMRKIWEELKSVRGTDLVAVDSPDAKVRVSLTGKHLLVRTEEGSKEKVDIKVPIAVVDALLSGEGDRLNVTAALETLIQMREADLVSVEDETSIVRVWIDGRSES
jgi:hypothetical protein